MTLYEIIRMKNRQIIQTLCNKEELDEAIDQIITDFRTETQDDILVSKLKSLLKHTLIEDNTRVNTLYKR